MQAKAGKLMCVVQAVLVVPAFVLIVMAVWFQQAGMAALVGITLILLWIIRCWWLGNTRAVWAWAGLVILAAGLWYATVRPSNDRIWAEDVARGVTAEVEGDVLTVRDVRNFDWRSETDFTPKWEVRTYRLDQLASVDLITSVWGSPAIAHVLVSFGFSDGQHLVFSAEIRREKTEVFSSVAGFFRRFELVLIAADERDIVRLRTMCGGETVSLFRVNATADQMRAMLLAYLERGNALAQQPEWYNTATVNCTTVIWRLARRSGPVFRWIGRGDVVGDIAEVLYDIGLIRHRFADGRGSGAGCPQTPGACGQRWCGVFAAVARVASWHRPGHALCRPP